MNVLSRVVELGMPHLGPSGLSDSWLLRELGDLHWRAVAAALGQEQSRIRDADGNRIYASFVRVQLRADRPFSSFEEGEQLTLDYDIQRFGDGMFFGHARAVASGNAIQSDLMSVFSRPTVGFGEALVSSPPVVPASFPSLAQLPALASGFRAMKANGRSEVDLAGIQIAAGEAPLHTMRYTPNPYQEFNGAKLLYFASYAAIADRCEADAARARNVMAERDWILRTGLLARDIYYFANCELGDAIDVSCDRLELSGSRVASAMSLVRARDNQLMARVFSVKELGS